MENSNLIVPGLIYIAKALVLIKNAIKMGVSRATIISLRSVRFRETPPNQDSTYKDIEPITIESPLDNLE